MADRFGKPNRGVIESTSGPGPGDGAHGSPTG